MQIFRFIIIALIFSLFPTAAFAQTSPTETTTEPDEARAELEKNALKLVDQTIGEINSLKLWENRALALAIAGDLIWKSDQNVPASSFAIRRMNWCAGHFSRKTVLQIVGKILLFRQLKR